MSSEKPVIEQLKKFDVFEGLSEADLSVVAKVLTPCKVAQGEQFIVQEQGSKDVYFIVTGRTRVQMSLPDKDTSEVLATLSAGDTVGELALARSGRRTASAIAQMESTMLKCDASVLNALFDQHPAIGMRVFRNLTRVLSDRLADTNMMLRNAVR